ncbi:MAG: hypothetical protein P8I56_15470, partial [Paracoccaceae bacterium]|nr:hypothetical protein [Paracoccaceae bacterium]
MAAAVANQPVTPLETPKPSQQLRNQLEQETAEAASGTVIAKAPETEAAPSRAVGYDDAIRVDAGKAQPANEVIAAIRTVNTNSPAAPRLRTPVPVIDDGVRAPVIQAEVASKDEGGFFQRLFSAPTDERKLAETNAPDEPPRVANLGTSQRWWPGAAPDVSSISDGEPELQAEIKIAAVQTEN